MIVEGSSLYSKIKLLYKIDFNLRQLNFICYKHVINWMLLFFFLVSVILHEKMRAEYVL